MPVVSTMDLTVASVTARGNIRDINSNNVQAGRDIYYGGSKAKRSDLADWVSDVDFSQYHSRAFERYTEGTLLWVFKSPEFVGWLRNGGMLWATGKPGAGKTVFASFVIEYLHKLADKDPKPTVCYIYCRYDRSRSTLQFFEAILRQLILRCHSANMERVEAAKEQGHRLTLNEILSILQETFRQVPNMFVIIDAFDECFDEPTRHQILQKLRMLRFVSILVTSRPLPSLVAAMGTIARLIIFAHGEDIKTHFQAQTEMNPTLARLIPTISGTDIESKLIERAGGMFLLAALHIADLVAQTNITQLLRSLKNLPKEATAVYAHTLERIRRQDPVKRRLAFHTLSWIIYALRPLKMIELRHALAIGGLNLDRMAEEVDLDDEETILSSCAGLISVNKSSWGGETIQFFHYTVQEFVQKARETQEFLSEMFVATSCLKVVSFTGAALNAPKYPLTEYACSAWGYLVHKNEHDDVVFKLALSQLADPATVRVLSGAWIRHEFRSYSGGYRGGCGATALHLIAIYGLVRTGKEFVTAHRETVCALINLTDSEGRTALTWAVRNGYPEVVRELLTLPNVDINSKEKNGQTPLSWAAQEGRYSLVKALLTHPMINVNSKGDFHETPLALATKNRHLEVVKELLGHPNIDVNSKKHGRTPLSCAAEVGHSDIVKVLVSHGNMDVNSRDEASGRTPLSWAAEKGHSDIVKVLVSHGDMDVNSRDEASGRTPLSWAAEKGHVAIVDDLLRHAEVDVDSKSNSSRTPFSYAAGQGHLEVMKLLLNYGASVDSMDNSGRTPLSYAARNGDLDIVKMLLNQPNIDVNSKDQIYSQTPLSWAAENGHLAVVKQLFDHPKIDVNLKDNSNRTPAFYAAQNGNLKILKLLLTHPSIDVNLKDNCGRTALSSAAQNGHLTVLKLLLPDRNVDVNSKDDFGRAPLFWAAESGRVAVVKEILDHPEVNVDLKDDTNRTPLFYAARNGHFQVVKVLFNHPGIDANWKDNLHCTALSYAAQNGHSDVLELLLSHPDIDVNSKDNTGRTAGSWAVQNRHWKAVKILLAHHGVKFHVQYDLSRWRSMITRPWPRFKTPRTSDWYIMKSLYSHPFVYECIADSFGTIVSTLSLWAMQRLGRTALSSAAQNGHLTVLKLLLRDSNIDVNLKDNFCRAPLFWAAENECVAVVNELLDHPEVNVDLKDDTNQTPLSYAARNGHFQVVKVLFNHPSIDANRGLIDLRTSSVQPDLSASLQVEDPEPSRDDIPVFCLKSTQITVQKPFLGIFITPLQIQSLRAMFGCMTTSVRLDLPVVFLTGRERESGRQ